MGPWAHPTKVTVTERAQLDPCVAFFVTGDSEKLVCYASATVGEARCRLGRVAAVIDGQRPLRRRTTTEA